MNGSQANAYANQIAPPSHPPGSFGGLIERLTCLVSRARDLSLDAANVQSAIMGATPLGGVEKKLEAVSIGYIDTLNSLMSNLSDELDAIGNSISALSSKI